MDHRIFDENYIEEAALLAMEQYQEECRMVKVLPQEDYTKRINNLLSQMVAKALGFVAIEGKHLVGYMTGYGSIDNLFGTSKGIFLPIHGHGARREDRNRIYSKLYQHAAKSWVEQDILSHAFAIYSHDQVTMHSFFRNGFGLRCVDAIMDIHHPALSYSPHPSIHCSEMNMDDLADILPLENHLAAHLESSPLFMPRKPCDLEELKKRVVQKKSRIFGVQMHEEVIAYLEFTHSGENFTCDHLRTINICGAYLYPTHRGQGIFKTLLSYALSELKKDGYVRCGVDFESINPTADAFWMKYFTPYTYSVTRRIDERIRR